MYELDNYTKIINEAYEKYENGKITLEQKNSIISNIKIEKIKHKIDKLNKKIEKYRETAEKNNKEMKDKCKDVSPKMADKISGVYLNKALELELIQAVQHNRFNIIRNGFSNITNENKHDVIKKENNEYKEQEDKIKNIKKNYPNKHIEIFPFTLSEIKDKEGRVGNNGDYTYFQKTVNSRIKNEWKIVFDEAYITNVFESTPSNIHSYISHVYDQAFKWIEKELDYQLWLNNHIKSVVNIMITHKNVLYEKYSDIYRSGGYNNPSEEYKKIFSIVYKEYEKSRK